MRGRSVADAGRIGRGEPPGVAIEAEGVAHESRRLPAAAHVYLPDLVYGSNDGIITTFVVVCGVVGASLSTRVILVLGVANLIADGFSMGASNFLARRSYAAASDRADRPTAARHGVATMAGFVTAGIVPLAAYLVPIPDDTQFLTAVTLTALCLFAVGASRTLVTKLGVLRSGAEMLAVGLTAAAVAYGIGALAATLT